MRLSAVVAGVMERSSAVDIVRRFNATIVALLLAALLGATTPALRLAASHQVSIPGTNASRIVVATDIHYIAPELRDNGKAFRAFVQSGDGRRFECAEEIVDAFLRDVRRLRPNALVISGDLTVNGEKRSHEDLAAKLALIEKTSGTRVFVVPGNHDIQNPWARKFEGARQLRTDSVTQDEFRSIYGEFGFSEAISRDATTLSYLAPISDGVWLLMLDTCDYRMNRAFGRPTTRGTISSQTLEWIRQCAERAKARGAQVITVMHHNVVDHSALLHSGYTIENSDAISSAFASLGLCVALTGHLHIQDIQRVSRGPAELRDIATSALSIYPHQFGVLEASPSGAVEYSTSRVEVDAWARESGLRDKRLTKFNESSKQHFVDVSFKKTAASLAKEGGRSAREQKLMAETMSVLNADYFAGTVDAVKDEVLRSEGYRLWLAAADTSFLKRYVLGMVPKTAVDNNRLVVPPPGR